MKQFLLSVVLLSVPRLAEACSVCAPTMPKKTLDAYLGMTVVLSAMPIVMFGIMLLAWSRFGKRKADS